MANFFVEHSNGSYILKKLPHIKFSHDSSDLPTNLSLDKSLSNQENVISQFSVNDCSNILDLNFPSKFGRIETDIQSSALDCTNVSHVQTCSQQTVVNSSSLNVPELENPANSTIPRPQCENSSANMNKSKNSSSRISRSKFLGQIGN